MYSIDECFLDLEGFPTNSLQDYGQTIRQTVKQNIGIPVCVGIAETKTLAKLANHCAKKGLAGRDGVCDFGTLTSTQKSTLFANMPVGEIWGVGRRISEKLQGLGIHTVEALRTADPEMIRRNFSVVLERTVRELNDIPCIELEHATARQQIMVSRSFGLPVTSLDDLRQSVAYFTTRAAEKLRRDGSVVSSVCVHIRTNPFKERDPQYDSSLVVPLMQPTDDTGKLVQAALQGLHQIYRLGFQYKKSGVLLMGLHPKGVQQVSLFDDVEEDTRASQRMQVMDAINRRALFHCHQCAGRLDCFRLYAASRNG